MGYVFQEDLRKMAWWDVCENVLGSQPLHVEQEGLVKIPSRVVRVNVVAVRRSVKALSWGDSAQAMGNTLPPGEK